MPRLGRERVMAGLRKARMPGLTGCGGTWGHAGGSRRSLRVMTLAAVAATQRRGSPQQRLLLPVGRRRRRQFSNPHGSYVKSRPRTVPGEGELHWDRYGCTLYSFAFTEISVSVSYSASPSASKQYSWMSTHWALLRCSAGRETVAEIFQSGRTDVLT